MMITIEQVMEILTQKRRISGAVPVLETKPFRNVVGIISPRRLPFASRKLSKAKIFKHAEAIPRKEVSEHL